MMKWIKNYIRKLIKKGVYRDDVALYQSALDPMRGCANQRYYIKCPDGSLVIPPGSHFPRKKEDSAHIAPKDHTDKVWRWSYETYLKKKDFLVFKRTKKSPLINEKGIQASYNIYTKSYLSEREVTGTKPRNFLSEKKFLNRRGSDYLKQLGISFNYSKPKELLIHILKICKIQNKDIVLDSSSGSGTTAEAVLDLNREDGGNRKFILVECEDYADKITAERVRRVIKGVPKAKDEKIKKGLGGSFTYCTLGEELNTENMLRGKALPDYKQLSEYVFYTATGKSLSKLAKVNPAWFIGETEAYKLHLIYKPDLNFLKSKESALHLDLAEAVKKSNKDSKKISLVFRFSELYFSKRA